MSEQEPDRTAEERFGLFDQMVASWHTVTVYPACPGADWCACGQPLKDCAVLLVVHAFGLPVTRRTWSEHAAHPS